MRYRPRQIVRYLCSQGAIGGCGFQHKMHPRKYGALEKGFTLMLDGVLELSNNFVSGRCAQNYNAPILLTHLF